MKPQKDCQLLSLWAGWQLNVLRIVSNDVPSDRFSSDWVWSAGKCYDDEVEFITEPKIWNLCMGS